MELYPGAETQQLAPLVCAVLGGDAVSAALQHNLDAASVAGKVWDNTILRNRLSAAKYIVRYRDSVDAVVSRAAAHKAKVPGQHSRLSPFNAQSDLFPNGIISERWFTKYTHDVPFAVVCRFDLAADAAGDAPLAQQLSAVRSALAQYGIRLMAVVVGGAGAERLAAVRHASGLASLAGFFHLDPAAGLARAAEAVCSAVLGTLKMPALDFYSAVEARVKQRFKKFYTMPSSPIDTAVQLSPKSLQARDLLKQATLLSFMHPGNMDFSLPALESAYKAVFELLAENAPLALHSSPHDTNLYWSWRTLLDVLAIHIVRAYFSVEDPTTALRKHLQHVESVPPMLPVGASVWTATQYHWLADLMAKIPTSALRELEKYSKERTRHGFGVSLDRSAELVTLPNLLYFKAASLLTPDSASGHMDNLRTKEDCLGYKIRLLQTARDVTEADFETMKSFREMLHWTMAECYYSLGDLANALANYTLVQESSWSSTAAFATRKIMAIHEEQGYTQGLISQLARLSTSKHDTLPETKTLPTLDGPVNLASSNFFLAIDVCLFNKAFSESHVYDTICTQIRIKSLFHPEPLKAAYPDSAVFLRIRSLTLHYDNNSRVELRSTDLAASNVQHISPENGIAEANFSALSSRPVVLDLDSTALEPGWFALAKVEAQFSIVSGDTVLANTTEVHLIDQMKTPFSHNLYVEESDTLSVRPIRLVGRSPARLLVKPFRPRIEIQRNTTEHYILLGEVLNFPLKIRSTQLLPQNIMLGETTIELKYSVLENSTEVKNVHASVNWDSMKDDEPLDITELLSGNAELKTSFNASVRASPNVQLENREFTLAVGLSLRVENSGEMTFYELVTYNLPVISRPFVPEFSIVPRKAAEGKPALPNPFVLGSKSDLTMPSPHRYWSMKVAIQKNELLERDVVITEVQSSVRSGSSDIHIEWLEKEKDFTTNSKHRYTPKNVTVVGTSKIFYKRENSENVNVYDSEEFEYVLPLQTPRVLLEVKKVEDAVSLEYSIENPTARILTFTTNLSVEAAEKAGVKWTFDAANETPLKQAPFPVLPFSQHRMTYSGSFDSERDIVELPCMSVLDMNYKVSLSTVALHDNVQVDEAGMRLFVR